MGRLIMLTSTLALAALSATGQTRQLDAHVHGTGNLDIAVEGDAVVMALDAPGADIVGFEHAAKNEADREAVRAALAELERPLELFVLPSAAGCSVVEASAELVTEDAEAEGGHEADHADGHGAEAEADHDHDHAAEEGHDGHDDEHAAHGEDGHDEHDAHGHDDHHDGDGHDEARATHSEFRAHYRLTCASPQAIDRIDFAYFERFPNAEELEVQVVSDSGARQFEVPSDSPVLSFEGQI